MGGCAATNGEAASAVRNSETLAKNAPVCPLVGVRCGDGVGASQLDGEIFVNVDGREIEIIGAACLCNGCVVQNQQIFGAVGLGENHGGCAVSANDSVVFFKLNET